MVCCCSIFLVVGVLALIYMKIKKYLQVPPVPKVEEIWWGSGKAVNEEAAIEPFKINIADEVIQEQF